METGTNPVFLLIENGVQFNAVGFAEEAALGMTAGIRVILYVHQVRLEHSMTFVGLDRVDGVSCQPCIIAQKMYRYVAIQLNLQRARVGRTTNARHLKSVLLIDWYRMCSYAALEQWPGKMMTARRPTQIQNRHAMPSNTTRYRTAQHG